MEKAIGLLELKSIPMGINAADAMVKAAHVDLIMASPVCPGKYIAVIAGNVGAVHNAMKSGSQTGETFVVEEHIIDRVHPSVLPALSGTAEIDHVGSIGIIETISALSSIKAADVVAKAAHVKLIEVRVARGLGGKGFLVFTGEISAVNSAVRACDEEMKETGEITSQAVIPSPSPELVKHLL